MSDYKFTDRYQALGIPYPDSKTMCKGFCEGTGFYPENNQADPLWIEQHKKAHTLREIVRLAWKYRDITYLWKANWKCDGWHFVKCAECGGTGIARRAFNA
jgi:hypothetical protein